LKKSLKFKETDYVAYKRFDHPKMSEKVNGTAMVKTYGSFKK